MFRPCLLVLGLAFAGCEKPVDLHLREGDAAARRADWNGARDAWARACTDAPGSAVAQAKLGSALFELGQREAAADAWKKAHAIDPAEAIAAAGLANLALQAGDPAAALAAIEGTGNSPLEARARLARGAADDAPKALALVEALLQARPDEPEALYLKGSALIALQKYAEAQAVLDRLQRTTPTSPLGPYGLARLAAAQQRTTDVLLNLRAAKQASGTRWNATAVARDPAFAFLAERPDFKELVGP